jgi:hypothetical protein
LEPHILLGQDVEIVLKPHKRRLGSNGSSQLKTFNIAILDFVTKLLFNIYLTLLEMIAVDGYLQQYYCNLHKNINES